MNKPTRTMIAATLCVLLATPHGVVGQTIADPSRLMIEELVPLAGSPPDETSPPAAPEPAEKSVTLELTPLVGVSPIRAPMDLTVPAIRPRVLPVDDTRDTEPACSVLDVSTPACDSPSKLDPESEIVDRIDATQTLTLTLERPTITRLKRKPVRDQIGNPDMLDSINISPTEYSLTGKIIGTTVLNFWFEGDDENGADVVSLLVNVQDDPERYSQFTDRVKKLQADLARTFPNSAIRLDLIGRQVVVRGQARDVEDAFNILQIIVQNIPEIAPPPGSSLNNLISEALGVDGSGQVESGTDEPSTTQDAISSAVITAAAVGGARGLDNFANNLGNARNRRNQRRLVSLLEIGGVQQVMLKVTVAEVNRTAARSIGADLSLTGGSSSFFSLLPGAAGLGATADGATLLVDRGNFDLALNALKSLDLARTLSEPNLTTLSGQPAQFQVGGSFPVPQITGFTGAGLQGVEFIPFGVQLQFVPTVTNDDRIRMTLQTEVSSTNAGGGATIGGANVPGLDTSNFSTTVELRHGQTLAIAGLITTDTASSSDRVPGLGSVPVLGRLFSSDTASYGESELVVLVTPYLGSPIDGDNPLPVPGSDYFEPSDLDFFILGRVEGHHGEDYRSPTRAEAKEIGSFHRLHQKYIIGQPGYSRGLFDVGSTEGVR